MRGMPQESSKPQPQPRIGPLTKEEAMKQRVQRAALEVLRKRHPDSEITLSPPDKPSGPRQA